MYFDRVAIFDVYLFRLSTVDRAHNDLYQSPNSKKINIDKQKKAKLK
jgi:hypothetical protein